MDEMALFIRFILQENLIMINNSEFIKRFTFLNENAFSNISPVYKENSLLHDQESVFLPKG